MGVATGGNWWQLLSTAGLQANFPDAVIQSVPLHRLPPAEQLRVMQNTTVFISTQGSSSFRFVFLPGVCKGHKLSSSPCGM
jgi:hypothetical protein